MSDQLIFAVPSKGRLMQETTKHLADAGINLHKIGHERGYKGAIEGYDNIEVRYMSASEIARFLKDGRIHIGITGKDLVHESMFKVDERVSFLKALGFGHADVVVALPTAWLDVSSMSDLDAIALVFRREHGRRLKVATKYTNITRRFFASHGVTGYRIVESLGATEGTVAAGTAELIVDITSTGATLAANGLKILDDGTILKSQAHLIASRTADWTAGAREAENELMAKLGG